MKHQGRASKAATVILAKTVIPVIVLSCGVWILWPGWRWVALGGTALNIVWAGFVLWFFRDPNPTVPKQPGIVVSPGHGLVDVVDQTDWPDRPGQRCQRLSIFLSVFDIHVQQAPVAGRVDSVRHQPGLFLNALKTESAAKNENFLVYFTANDAGKSVVAVRLIAGLIARRILPWVAAGDLVEQGERISLIQFGSRVDLYLPLNATVQVKVGDRVTGGESIVARLNLVRSSAVPS